MAIMCPAAVALTVEEIPLHFMVCNDDFNQTTPLYTCYENFANPKMTKVYTAVLFALIYLSPLAIIAVMYGTIGVKLCSSVVINRIPQGGNIHVRGRRRAKPMFSKKKIQAIKMLILVTLLFMLSWLPLWTLMMLADYAGLEREQLDLLDSYIFPFAHWPAFANSSVNPIICGYYNDNVKRGFQAVCNSATFSSLARRSMTACFRSERSAQVPLEGCNCRNGGGNNNRLIFVAGSRVHNDEFNSDKHELERRTRVGCVGVRSGRNSSHQGIEMATMKMKGGHSEALGKASPPSVSMYQAWEK
ncbi:neuropeptide FF receptor 1 like 2 [Festucalex cinctus]